MASGFLYILANLSMPGLVKVGKTTRNPSNRVRELSAATGVPTSFMLVYFEPVEDCDAAESWAHQELERRGYRANADREFFSAPTHEAVEILKMAKAARGNDLTEAKSVEDEHMSTLANQEKAKELYDLGFNFYNGTDTVLINKKKALALFEQSAMIGYSAYSGMSASMAGMQYEGGHEAVSADVEKSLSFYQRAVACGSWIHLGKIAVIFLEAGQKSAAEKHWIKFFDRASMEIDKITDADLRKYYLDAAINNGVLYCMSVFFHRIDPIISIDKLSIFKEALFEAFQQHISAGQSLNAYRGGLVFLISQFPELKAKTPPELPQSSIMALVPADDMELFQHALQVAIQEGVLNATLFQTRLRLGHARSRRIVDYLDQMGLLGPTEAGKPRKVNLEKAREILTESRASGSTEAVPKAVELLPTNQDQKNQMSGTSVVPLPLDDGKEVNETKRRPWWKLGS